MTQRFLPYGRQSIDDDDIAAVTAVLKSEFLTQGPEVDRFEAALCAATGARHAVAYSHGTAALFGACFAVGVGPGDEVVTSPITFAASANCAAYLGARPCFADVDPATALVDPAALARACGPRTKAVIPVHFAGQPADLAAIAAFTRPRGIRIIADAAHALGATLAGQPIGAEPFSDAVIYSFHPVKHVTTGEGGAVTTNDDGIAERLRLFRNHGIERRGDHLRQPSPGPWYHEMQLLGHNFRLTDLQAALGTSQLGKLDRFVARRRAIANRYAAAFAGSALVRPLGHRSGTAHAWHLYVIEVEFERAGTSRAEVMQALRARGIGTQVHYIPCYRHPWYADQGWNPADFPCAEAYYARALSLPIFPAMDDGDVDRVAAAVRDVVGG